MTFQKYHCNTFCVWLYSNCRSKSVLYETVNSAQFLAVAVISSSIEILLRVLVVLEGAVECIVAFESVKKTRGEVFLLLPVASSYADRDRQRREV